MATRHVTHITSRCTAWFIVAGVLAFAPGGLSRVARLLDSVFGEAITLDDCTWGIVLSISPCSNTYSQMPNATNQTFVFSVMNAQNADSSGEFQASCSREGVVTSCSVPSSVHVPVDVPTPITVTYSTGASPGAGALTLKLVGWAADGGGGQLDSAMGRNTINVPPPYQVSVWPYGMPDGDPVTANPGLSNSQVFIVGNTGTADATFNLSAACSRVASNCQAPATVSVTHFMSQNVTVTYQAGVNDTGTVKLFASYGGANDSGWVRVTAPPFMSVSTDFNNNDNQNVALCANGCFAATASVSTVPYYSLGSARNVTLVYHGDRVSMRPFVYADVSLSAGASNPQEYWLQLQDSAGVFVPFLNGDPNKIRFNNATSPPVRLAGQFDASSYAKTGTYRFTIIVTALYGDHTETIAKPVTLLLVNERKSPIARGWTVAGVPRLYLQWNNSVATITKGDGSAVVFGFTYQGWVAPLGEFSALSVSGNNYVWRSPDSTKVWFRATDGLADSIVDRYGNAVRFEYDGSSRLVKIYDPIRTYNGGASRSYIALTYAPGGYGLAQIQEPSPVDGGPTGGRITYVNVGTDSTLQSFVDPGGGGTAFGYDVLRRLLTVTDRRGGTLTFSYATSNSWKLARVDLPQVPIDAGGGSTQLATPSINYVSWQAVGVPTSSTATTPYTPVGPDSVKAQVTDPSGHVTAYTVDRWGQPLRVIEPLGRTTTITRSGILAVRVVYPSGAKDTASYNADGLLEYSAPAGQAATWISYGAYGRVIQISGALQPTRTFYIGVRGHIDSTKVNFGYRTTYRADARGRDTLVVDPLSHTTRLHYESRFGHLDSTVALDSVGARRSVVATRFDGYGRDSVHLRSSQPADTVLYDALNRVRRTASGADGGSVVFGYDSLFLIRVQDPKGQVYRKDYNALGWMTRVYDPADTLNRFVSYRYNLDGLKTSTTNRRGQRLDLAYDPLHRVVSKTGDNVMSDYFAYDTVGLRMVGWNAVSRDSIFTSAAGWTDSVVTILAGQRFRRFYRPWTTNPNTRFQLDSVGISTTAPIAFLARRNFWNAATGVLDSLKINGRALKFHWNGELLPDTTTFPTGLKRRVEYTPLHEIGQVSFTDTAVDTLLRVLYSHDSLGRITGEDRPEGSSGVRTRGFAYDGHGRLRRLVGSSSSGTQLYGFEYDSVGNMQKSTDSAHAITTAGSYITGDRQTGWGTLTYTYDNDGNRITKTGGSTNFGYHWTADGRLDTVTAGTVKLAYDYNAFGQVVRRSRNAAAERHFLWDQGQLLAELSGTATARVAEYAYYPGVDQPAAFVAGTDTGSVRYYHQDARGNVMGIFSSSVAQRLEYSPWGGLDSATGALGDTSRLRWKGLMWEGDSTQLYYVRARWYDPQSRRFMTEDPIGLAGGINPYVYGGNDPINNRDPSGRYMDDCEYVSSPTTSYVQNGVIVIQAGYGFWVCYSDPWSEDPGSIIDGTYDGTYDPWAGYEPGAGGGGGQGPGLTQSESCGIRLSAEQCGLILQKIENLQNYWIDKCRDLGDAALERYDAGHFAYWFFLPSSDPSQIVTGQRMGTFTVLTFAAFYHSELRLQKTIAHEEAHHADYDDDTAYPLGGMCGGPI